MATKTDEMFKHIVEQGNDIKWIKETMIAIHTQVKLTNGRVGKLESERGDYVKKEEFTTYKEGVNNSNWDFKKSVAVALITATVTIIGFFVAVKYGVKIV